MSLTKRHRQLLAAETRVLSTEKGTFAAMHNQVHPSPSRGPSPGPNPSPYPSPNPSPALALTLSLNRTLTLTSPRPSCTPRDCALRPTPGRGTTRPPRSSRVTWIQAAPARGGLAPLRRSAHVGVPARWRVCSGVRAQSVTLSSRYTYCGLVSFSFCTCCVINS
jgi:hypothetical protein